MEWVQDRTQEPEDVPQLIVPAGLYWLPIRAVFLPSKVILVPVLAFGGPLFPQAPSPLDLCHRAFGDMVHNPPLLNMLYLLRNWTMLHQFVCHCRVGDGPQKVHEEGPQPHILEVLH
jgi:hypothetical protein